MTDLSRHFGLRPATLRRQFRDVVGVTPLQFLEACRLERFREELRDGESVTDAVYAAGFGSSSRLYERIDARFGMTPTEYQAGGAQLEISYAWLEGRFGLILVAATDRGVCSVEFGESREVLLQRLQREFPRAHLEACRLGPWEEPLRAWIAALERLLAHGGGHPELPLDLRGSAFRIKVWRYLMSIPRGETRTYREVAEAVGNPRAARAVAQACAANRLAVLIPCHRVIRASGGLGGYRWGEDRKRQLLALEGVVPGRDSASAHLAES